MFAMIKFYNRHKVLTWAIGILLVVTLASAAGDSTPAPSTQEANVSNQILTAPPQQPSTATEEGPDIKTQQAPAPATTENVQPAQPSDSLSNDNYYINVDGNTVHSPAYSETGQVPAGATAQCRDGTYSFSQHRQGTCSHHGGVIRWLY